MTPPEERLSTGQVAVGAPEPERRWFDPLIVQRVLIVVAAATLLQSLTGFWQRTLGESAVWGALFGTVFVLLAGAAAWACFCRSQLVADRLGGLVLLLGIIGQAEPLRRAAQGKVGQYYDESILMHLASRAIGEGHNPYTLRYPQIHDVATLLMNGRTVDSFGYPSLFPLFGGVIHAVLPRSSETAVLGYLTLVVTAVLLYALLPRPLRPVAVPLVFALGPLPFMAARGYPTLLAVPLLLVAAWRWPLIGTSGRLGVLGVVQAAALGLAAATQQLAWFLVPFLLVGLWRLRRGNLDRPPAAWVTLRYAGVGALGFLLPNLPFIVLAPRAWLRGVTDPLRQHAFFDGPGIMSWSWRVIGHSGALQFYSYAGLLVLVTLLGAMALFPRTLVPAAVALPWIALWFTLRTEIVYYSSFIAVTAFSVAVNRPEWFAAARPLTLPRLGRLSPLAIRRGLPALGAVSVLATLLVAMVSPAPLGVRVVGVGRSSAPVAVTALTVDVRNTSDDTVHPAFVTERGSKQSRFWRVLSGPRALRPGQQATYRLRPDLGRRVSNGNPGVLWVVSDDPQTLSSGSIPRKR